MTVRVKVHYGKCGCGVCDSKGLKNGLANEWAKYCAPEVVFSPFRAFELSLLDVGLSSLCLLSYLCGLKLWRSATALRTLTSARTALINRCRVEQDRSDKQSPKQDRKLSSIDMMRLQLGFEYLNLFREWPNFLTFACPNFIRGFEPVRNGEMFWMYNILKQII